VTRMGAALRPRVPMAAFALALALTAGIVLLMGQPTERPV